MTGRYPIRIGGGWTINSDEVTIAEVLKKEGYSTACIGKWDMSQRKELEGSVPNDLITITEPLVQLTKVLSCYNGIKRPCSQQKIWDL